MVILWLQAVKKLQYADYEAVVVEVSGRGHYTGTATFTMEQDDPLYKGFLLH